MNSERWARIEEIFQAALDQPQQQRSSFLDQNCAGDAELREEVESLLAHSEHSVNPIVVAVSEALQSLPASSEQQIGQHIGPYQILGIIGQGGMGTVYHATRDDDQYRKQVALKIVKRGMDTDHIIHRFRQERQILAGLDHPNIAGLLDGGTTEDGLPYFVMEYIDGDTIIEHSKKNSLSITERLKLFHDVCLAVQHAHQKLIIHRDIKPTNILVGPDGVPKLLDFGIAKLLKPDPAFEMPTATMTILRLMTPDYASPEQVRGLAISTATDVYSLGAVLYELLAGQRPHLIKNYTPTEIERAICIDETEKPSAAAARATGARSKLPRLLAGDLDNIVLMCMRKEPERRYQSAGQLAEDIERFLRNLPVIARPDTLIYRTGKFVRRNKFALLSVAIIILSLVGGIFAALYQARRAERRFQDVRKLANTFLFEFHDRIKDLPGSTEAREMVVVTALQYLDSLAHEAHGDPSLQWELAEAYQKVADVQGDPRGGNLGHPEAAIQSYTKALTVMQQLKKDDPDSLRVLRSLATCYYKVGDLQVEMGNLREGTETLRNGLDMAQTIHDRKTGNQDDLLLFIRLQRSLGDAVLKSRNPQETLRIDRKALELSEQLLKDSPGDLAKHQWTLTMIRIGEAQIETGDLLAGIETYKKVLEVRTELVQNRPFDTEMKREWRVVHVWLGNHYGGLDTFNLGDKQTAEQYYQKALSIAEDLVAQDPKNARFQYDLSICYAKVAETQLESDPASALDFYGKAIAINENLMANSPEEFRYLSRKALYQRSIAVPLKKLGHRAAGAKSLQESLRTLETMIRMSPANSEAQSGLHATLLALGHDALDAQDFSGALAHFQRALAISQKQTANSRTDLYAQWRLADSYFGLGRYQAMRKNWQEAKQWYGLNYEIWNGWSKRAVSNQFNTVRAETAMRELSRCDQELARQGS